MSSLLNNCMKHYTVYKTTNIINRKYYIGTHVTNNPTDSYLGSGTRLAKSIKKYGKESFYKEILFDCTSEEEMFRKENELVNETVLKDKQCLNLIVGGKGGFSYINKSGIAKFKGRKHTQASIKKMLATKRDNGTWCPTDECREERAEANRIRAKNPARNAAISKTVSGRIKTEEHKKKIAESLRGKKQNRVQCPYCKRVGGEQAFKRYHFDNCKNLRI